MSELLVIAAHETADPAHVAAAYRPPAGTSEVLVYDGRIDEASGDVTEAPFWIHYQPGFRFSVAEPGTPAFFADVERHRYALEPHIPELVQFERWRNQRVLDAGCGIATDGALFARAGAKYTGLDASSRALELARRRFELESLRGNFVQSSITNLPFPDNSFDLVYSHGVIHHVEETEAAVNEFHRVLVPGGTSLAMVYHRRSLNYVVTIMGLRRALVPLLLLPGGMAAAAKLTGESRDLLDRHRELLARHGMHYLADRSLFLSNNTDGPGNPLSKAYTRSEAQSLFRQFASVQTEVRFLNLRIYPWGERIAGSGVGRLLEQRIGWHLYVEARKQL